MNASDIVDILLGEAEDFRGFLFGDEEDLQRRSWEAEQKLKWEKHKAEQEDRDLMRSLADVAMRRRHIPTPIEPIPVWPIPPRYYRSKSKLLGLAKREAQAAHVAHVEIVPGDELPSIVSGSRGGFFTKGGTPIEHPSAYSKVGWSNMEYRTNDEVVSVGADWLFQQLPADLSTYMRYVGRDLQRRWDHETALHWKDQHLQNYAKAYDEDEPALESLAEIKCI